jgi:hypothetical protein
MEQKSLVVGIIFLLVGVVGGYYYGLSTGQSVGREALLAEQAAEIEEAKEEAQQQLTEAANPFEDANVNPFEGSYRNPFEGGGVNPFAQ